MTDALNLFVNRKLNLPLRIKWEFLPLALGLLLGMLPIERKPFGKGYQKKNCFGDGICLFKYKKK